MSEQKPKSIAEQLAEGKIPESGAQQGPGLGAEQGLLGQLLQLMLLKEGREAAKEQQGIEQDAQRQKKRDQNSKQHDTRKLLDQARCKHKKGGKRGPKTQNVDYALGQHTFITAETVIRCLICGMKWHKHDTVEYLLRNGRKISNHTHLGWNEVVNMLGQSSNTPTTSEILIDQVRPGSDLSTTTDAAGRPFVNRVVDLEGKPVTDYEL